MVLDRLLYNSTQLQAVRGLDLLPKQNELTRLLKHYLVSCRVEGKSKSTITGYADVVRSFILFSRDNEVPLKVSELNASQKKVITTGMGGEIERARIAIRMVKKGRTISIVCSGDAGIYGMAGLVSEILHEQGEDLAIEVIPGVPALVAAAALLGAPVMNDFAAISLSDYLVTWAEISQRLKLAAQGDFIIALYNPSSKSRKNQLAEAKEIILQYRSKSTPVGIVTNAYRQKQRVVITDLEHMLDYEVGMNTTIIIGSSTTFTFNSRMVTPRGYQTKYNLKSETLP